MNHEPSSASAWSVIATPRTDSVVNQYDAARAVMLEQLARDLERELTEVKAAMSGRTISCEMCNVLTAAIINIHRWTGSRRVARECKRVLPNVGALSSQNGALSSGGKAL